MDFEGEMQKLLKLFFKISKLWMKTEMNFNMFKGLFTILP